MRAMTIQELAAAVGGRVLGGSGAGCVTGVSTDSRSVKPGDAFVAIRGERFDGHAFVETAIQAGAAAAVVAEDGLARFQERAADAAYRPAAPLIVVAETVAALGRLAAAYRRTLRAIVIGITGSNGKTTTREMTQRVLSTRGPTGSAIRSYNNHIGVPLTLLGLAETHRFAVLELGTSGPGEIRRLAAMAQPEIGVVTNIADTHLAGLGSREGVARAKGELIAALPEGGTAVLNGDDGLCAGLARLLRGGCVIRFGRSAASDVFATDVRTTADGTTFRLNGRRPVRLRVLGEHNVLNALAALAVGRRLGVDEQAAIAALEGFAGVPMRTALKRANGLTVLDDSFNANPQSMAAALATLAGLPVEGRRVFVAGDMRELGERSGEFHRALGRQAAAAPVDLLVAVGEEAEGIADGAVAGGLSPHHVYRFASTDEAVSAVPALLRFGDLVLVKGSHAMALERVVEAILG